MLFEEMITVYSESNTKPIIQNEELLGFEVLTAVSTKMAVFWDYTALHPRKQQFLKSY
jgi:hypothetical protein